MFFADSRIVFCVRSAGKVRWNSVQSRRWAYRRKNLQFFTRKGCFSLQRDAFVFAACAMWRMDLRSLDLFSPVYLLHDYGRLFHWLYKHRFIETINEISVKLIVNVLVVDAFSISALNYCILLTYLHTWCGCVRPACCALNSRVSSVAIVMREVFTSSTRFTTRRLQSKVKLRISSKLIGIIYNGLLQEPITSLICAYKYW